MLCWQSCLLDQQCGRNICSTICNGTHMIVFETYVYCMIRTPANRFHVKKTGLNKGMGSLDLFHIQIQPNKLTSWKQMHRCNVVTRFALPNKLSNWKRTQKWHVVPLLILPKKTAQLKTNTSWESIDIFALPTKLLTVEGEHILSKPLRFSISKQIA